MTQHRYDRDFPVRIERVTPYYLAADPDARLTEYLRELCRESIGAIALRSSWAEVLTDDNKEGQLRVATLSNELRHVREGGAIQHRLAPRMEIGKNAVEKMSVQAFRFQMLPAGRTFKILQESELVPNGLQGRWMSFVVPTEVLKTGLSYDLARQALVESVCDEDTKHHITNLRVLRGRTTVRRTGDVVE